MIIRKLVEKWIFGFELTQNLRNCVTLHGLRCKCESKTEAKTEITFGSTNDSSVRLIEYESNISKLVTFTLSSKQRPHNNIQRIFVVDFDMPTTNCN